eukprot:jgi/Pico_ML_1/52605/g3285.t1
MADTEMKDVDANGGTGDVNKQQKDDKGGEEGKKTPLQQMHANLKLLSKAVATKESRTINRVLRQSFAMRKNFSVDMVERLSNAVVSDVEARDLLLQLLQKIGRDGRDEMEMENGKVDKGENLSLPKQLPEAEALVFLIVLVMLVDRKLYADAKVFANKSVEFVERYNRRTLDLIAARIFFYLSWSYECTGTLSESKEVVDIYSTNAPISAFHSRISFCLDTHNEAVKAMRYEGSAQRMDIESAEARRERLEQEKELAKHIAEEDDDDF